MVTHCFSRTGLLWILPLIQSAPFDAARDFVPVVLSQAHRHPGGRNPSLPVKSVRELITLAKARPGELDYASGAVGASSHLAAELFKSMARVDIVPFPYRGAGPAVLGIVSGQVQVMFATASSVRPHIDASRLKALAVTSARRSAVFPALPTVAEAAGA
jgi:tripartite-type tricarboxylate transporter receptor subunit TctC